METSNNTGHYYHPLGQQATDRRSYPHSAPPDQFTEISATVIESPNEEPEDPLFASKVTKIILVALVISGLALVIIGCTFFIMKTHLTLAIALTVGGGLDLSFVLLFVLLSLRDKNIEKKIINEVENIIPNDQLQFYQETQSPDLKKEFKSETIRQRQSKIKRQTSLLNQFNVRGSQLPEEDGAKELTDVVVKIGKTPSDHYTKIPKPTTRTPLNQVFHQDIT